MPTLSDIPAPARTLGFAGAIPFIAGAVSVWSAEGAWVFVALNAQVYYGCAILAFLGAVHWGRALASDLEGDALWRPLLWSVLPSLLAWVAALVKPDLGLVMLIVGVAAAYAIDRACVTSGWFPEWYGVLRKYLSAIVIVSLGASLLRVVG